MIPYQDTEDLMESFRPIRDVWCAGSDTLKARDIWLENPLQSLDIQSLTKTIADTITTLDQLMFSFNHLPKMQDVIRHIEDILKDFKPYVRLVKALRNPDLKEEHWKSISTVTNIRVEFFPVITLQQCLDMGIAKHIDEIVEISEEATKEYLLVEALRMKVSNEKFMKGLVEEEIIMDIRSIYRKSIEEFLWTIFEDMFEDFDKILYFRSIVKEVIESARVIGFDNVFASMRILIEEHILTKIPYSLRR